MQIVIFISTKILGIHERVVNSKGGHVKILVITVVSYPDPVKKKGYTHNLTPYVIKTNVNSILQSTPRYFNQPHPFKPFSYPLPWVPVTTLLATSLNNLAATSTHTHINPKYIRSVFLRNFRIAL